MKIITATSVFNNMGREDVFDISIAHGKWAVFIRPIVGELINWRVA